MDPRHHLREYEGVDQQEHQRIEEGPEETENRTAVAGFQITDDEGLDQPAVSKQRCEISKRDHRLCAFPPAAVEASSTSPVVPVRNRSRPAPRTALLRRASCPPRRGPHRDPLLARPPAQAPTPNPAALRRSPSPPAGPASRCPSGTTSSRAAAP